MWISSTFNFWKLLMNSIYRNLFKKLGGYSIFFFIFLSISGCSEFHKSFTDEFNSSFVSNCMEEYDKNPTLQISRMEFSRYCDCVLDGLKDSTNRIKYSKLIPGNMDDITDYCIEAELNL